MTPDPTTGPELLGFTLTGGRNLVTPHPPGAYPGLTVLRPGLAWQVSVIVPEDGQTLHARGGERLYGYTTPSGARAEALELEPGDRATLVRGETPGGLAEWRVRRAAAGRTGA